MIDPKLLRTDPDAVRRSQQRRGDGVQVVDELLSADTARRSAITAFEQLRAEQKDLGKQVSRASGAEKAELLDRTRELAAQVKQRQADSDAASQTFDQLLASIGNIVGEGVPEGGEDDYRVLETIGEPRDFAAEGFEPRDHLQLGEALGAIDTERGAKVSGSRFYFLTGIGAQLELALINYAMTKAAEWGFRPMIPPALVKRETMEGTGFLGQAADDVYHLERDDLYLVGTAEVPLAAYHADEIIDPDQLPLRYAGYSPSFRREAGSYGKDTRGIFRVHWFDKVEMFVYCDPAQADAEHRRLLAYEKEFIESLELPFQTLELAGGDLGLSASRKFDCYAWLPTQQRYREITSTSNCTDFQARRLGIRTRSADGLSPVATLNGTLVAITRMIIMLLENHQLADGSVRVPVALRPYLGGQDLMRPIS